MTPRKTSLNITEVRAGILFDALAINPGVRHLEEITDRLPYFRAWGDGLGLALDVLVSEGSVTQADGVLCLHRHRRGHR